MDPVLLPDAPDAASRDDVPTVRLEEASDGTCFVCDLDSASLSLDSLRALAGDGQSPDALDFDAAYARASAALNDGASADAAAAFLVAAATGQSCGRALYGLAASLCAGDRNEAAHDIAVFLAACPNAPPRAQLLAGFTAYKMGRKDVARRHLARAARQARGLEDAREELRFAQVILLKQQFVS